MSYTYAQRKRAGEPAAPGTAPGPSLEALRAGIAQPSAAQLGTRVDLPEAIREKFENAFGADLSALRLYRSQTVADAGAQAVAQGNRVAFAPGLSDFGSRRGQTLLGHELSHVVAQQRGEVRGAGLLRDPALEARADREGAMAAAGQQIAAPTAALSTASAAPAAGPMQAKKKHINDRDEFARQYARAAYGQELHLKGDLADYQNGIVNPYANPVSDQAPQDASNALQDGPIPPQDDDADAAVDAVEAGNAVTQSSGTPTAVNADSRWRKARDRVNDPFKMLQNGMATGVNFVNAGVKQFKPDAMEKWVWGGNMLPLFGGLVNAIGMGTSTFGFFNNAASAIRGFQNIKAGGKTGDALSEAADAIGNLGSMGASTLGTINKVMMVPKALKSASKITKAMGKLGSSSGKVMPILSIITGGISTLTGFRQGYRGGKSLKAINNLINSTQISQNQDDADQIGQGPLGADQSDQGQQNAGSQRIDQQRMLQIFRHGARVQERNRTGGYLKSASGFLSAGGGALTLGGLAPLGFLSAGLGALTGLAGSIYSHVKSKQIRRDVIAEELGIADLGEEIKTVKNHFKGRYKGYMTDNAAMEILLKSRGYGTEQKTFGAIRKKRAAEMLTVARGGPNYSAQDSQKARDFITAMGINPLKNGSYAEGALDLLAAKMG